MGAPFETCTCANKMDIRNISNTLFTSALVVPQLSQACITVLNKDTQPGSGLKTLRSVCRDCRRLLMSAVRGYTLQLVTEGDEPQGGQCETGRAVLFLEQVRLVSLRVCIPSVGEWESAICCKTRYSKKIFLCIPCPPASTWKNRFGLQSHIFGETSHTCF